MKEPNAHTNPMGGGGVLLGETVDGPEGYSGVKRIGMTVGNPRKVP